MDKHIENIGQMCMTFGDWRAEQKIDLNESGISSTDIISLAEIWSKEFQAKYDTGSADPASYEKYDNLGNPFGYLAAIDAFVEMRAKEIGLFKQEDISARVNDVLREDYERLQTSSAFCYEKVRDSSGMLVPGAPQVIIDLYEKGLAIDPLWLKNKNKK